jgi:hypothetical protein
VFAGCAAQTDDEDGGPLDAENDLTSSVKLPANGSKTVQLNATKAADVTVTVDCHVAADPDDVGNIIKVDGSGLGASSTGEPARSGFWQKTLNVTAGSHSITIQNQGGAVSCSVRSAPVATAATCRAWSAWHSANPDHTHLRVGVEAISAGWEPFPASGNHWGSWAAWNKVYPKAIKRGFLLHDLEHGGVVFSYKCASASESADCKKMQDELVQLVNDAGLSRVIVTPDPTQPQKYAVRAWRWAYTSDCLDEGSAKAFAQAHIKHGREDIDADPPIPFDPTTTNVPCQDLMAAPDSCN